MLVVRLDTPDMRLPWKIVFAPFNISVLLLLLLNCCMPNSSRWWFGIKDDYCKFVFVRFPGMRTFANCAIYVSETPQQNQRTTAVNTTENNNSIDSSTNQPQITQQPSTTNNNNRSNDKGSLENKIPVKFDLFSPD